MDNLMTLIMSIVREITKSGQKMSIMDAQKALSTKGFGTLNDSTNLNSLLDDGCFSVRNSANKPVRNWGTVLIFNSGDRVTQLYIADNATTYIRTTDIGQAFAKSSWTKLGGVINPVLTALRALSIGGVRYVA